MARNVFLLSAYRIISAWLLTADYDKRMRLLTRLYGMYSTGEFAKEQPEEHSTTAAEPCLPPTDHPSLNAPAHSPLHSYCRYLRAYFGKSSLPTETKWQPSATKSYINLAVIRREKVTHEELLQFMLATLHGDVDEILKIKEPVKIEHIFDSNPGEDLQCILVEGAPGVGKTTLAWQVCHRWGRGDLFQQYALILLVKLREEVLRKATSLANLLISQEDERTKLGIAEYLKQTNGKKVLVILEGLDELPISLLTQQSVFTKLFSGTLLPRATILVTSRPSATVQLWDKWKYRISRHIEVLGFTKDNIAVYISTNLDGDDRKDFERYLSINPHIRSLMYVPINCTIVIAVYKDCLYYHRPPPRSVTELYTCLVECILRRYLKDHNYNDKKFKTLANLPSPVHDRFCTLTELAYEGVMNQQYIYSTEIEHLGFMDVVAEEHPLNCSYNLSYNFLHLSIQEYLAARYISSMPLHEQEQVLREVCHMKRLRNTCRYLAGITKFKDIDRTILKEVIESEFSKTLDEQEESRRLEMFGIIHDLLEATERLLKEVYGEEEEEEMHKIAVDLLKAAQRLFKQNNNWVKQKKDEWRTAIQILKNIERLVFVKRTRIEEDRWKIANDLLKTAERLGKQLNREMNDVGKETLYILKRIDEIRLLREISEHSALLATLMKYINRHHEPKHAVIITDAVNNHTTASVIKISTYALQLLSESEATAVLERRKVYECILLDYNSPIDFSTLGYCIAHSNCQWWLQLGTFQQQMKSTEGVEMFVQKLKSHRRDCQPSYRVYSLNIYHNNPDCAQKLLTVFPGHIYPHMKRLLIHYDFIQPLPQCVPVLISRIKHLRLLILEGATTCTLIDTLQILANSSNPTLTALQLSMTSFNLSAMRTLCSALLCRSTSIATLILYNCGIDNQQASILREILGNLCRLNILDLSFNDIHDREAAAIAKATRRLQIVELQGNPISAELRDQLATYDNVHLD